jgi:hypothetical protein
VVEARDDDNLEPDIEPLVRLNRDLKKAAATLTATEARFLVGAYYTMQRDRIRAAHQARQLGKRDEPHTVLSWLFDNTEILERNIKSALGTYALANPVGKWSLSIVGIGPVISAGLLAHIDLEPFRCARVRVDGPFYDAKVKKACTPDEPHGPECTRAPLATVGQLWRFAGLDPTAQWKEGTKRPWNGDLKRLCWIIGESFTKQSGHDKDFYGKLYVARKIQEVARNLDGQFAEQAKASLSQKRWSDDTDALVWYSGRLTKAAALEYFNAPTEKRMGLAKKLAGEPGSGVQMLPPARIQLRSQRYAVKLFLAHWHAVAYRYRYGMPPPKPYVITHLGHAHEITVPNSPWPD